MEPKSIAYWVTTVLFCLALTGGGLLDATLAPEMVENMRGLGYPDHFTRILGVWKLLGVVALLAPGLPRLKEWAYAGFFFNLTGAALSHLAVDGPAEALPPVVLLVLWAVSWSLAPASRRLGQRVPGVSRLQAQTA